MTGLIAPQTLRCPIWVLACFAVFMAMGLAVVAWGLWAANAGLIWSGGFDAVVSAGLFIAASHSETVLEADEITRRSLLSTRRMKRADIAGFRALHSQYNYYAGVELFSGSGAKMTVQAFGRPDVEAWVQGLPDVDKVEREKSDAMLAGDPMLGATPAERKTALSRMRAVQYALYGFGACDGIWLIFRPSVLPFILAWLSPVVAIAVVAAFQQRVGLLTESPDRRPNVAGLLLVGFAVGFTALDLHGFVDTVAALIAAALLALVGVGVCWNIDRGSLTRHDGTSLNWGNVVILFAALFAWVGGSIGLFDVFADHGPGQTFKTTVASNQITRGKWVSYWVDLAPWGSFPHGFSIESRPLYESADVGDPVCVRLHPGALHLRWLEAKRCSSRPAG